jgi:hypothetical protein
MRRASFRRRATHPSVHRPRTPVHTARKAGFARAPSTFPRDCEGLESGPRRAPDPRAMFALRPPYWARFASPPRPLPRGKEDFPRAP